MAKQTNGKLDPKCPYCQDDGGKCARCGTGFSQQPQPGPKEPSRAWTWDNRPQTQTPGPSYKDVRGEADYKGTPAGAYDNRKLDRPVVAGGCNHTAQQPALTVHGGRRKLYGAQGGKLKAEGLTHIDLIIDLAGLVSLPKPFVMSTSARARKYASLNHYASPDLIRLDWPDMTAPVHVPISFWLRLWAMLPEHTVVACMGGHGRTGTALAALLVADGREGQEAIDMVRTKHCPRAIETARQEAYIKQLALDYASLTEPEKR
jgi:hypothetical protein